MNSFNHLIEKYIVNHTQEENELLKQIDRETHLKTVKSAMICGHLQGRFLSLLSHLLNPKRILELGTFTGYATLSMAEGLTDDGKIFTIEKNEELFSIIENNFNKSNLLQKIVFLKGDALEIIPKLDEKWDLIFIDAEKVQYKEYFLATVDRVKTNGLILVDNVLWHGNVVDTNFNDMRVNKIKEFNNWVHQDTRVQNVLLPLRDGLMMLRKV